MSPAEELPALYRALLDRVAQIEAEGHRKSAYRLRAAATKIYSKCWDDRARRALQELLSRTVDARAVQPEPGHGPQQRSVTAA